MTLGILLRRVSKCCLISLFLRGILRTTLNVSLFFLLIYGASPPKKTKHRMSIFITRTDTAKDGTTALHLAAHFGSQASVDVLLDASCDPNATRSDNGATAVHLTAQAGQVQALRKLFLGTRIEDLSLVYSIIIADRTWACSYF